MDTGGERILDNLYELLTLQQDEIENLKAAQDKSTVEGDKIASEDCTENDMVKTAAFKKWFLKTISFDPTSSAADGDDGSRTNMDPKASKSVEKTSSIDQTDPTTNAIPQICVEMLNRWFHSIHLGSKVQEKLKTMKCPANADVLKRVVINEELKREWIDRNR